MPINATSCKDEVNMKIDDFDVINSCMLLSCHLRVSEWIWTL